MLTLEQAKLHLRVDHPDDDPYIAALVAVASEYIAGMITPAPVNGVPSPAPAVTETQRQAARLLLGHWYANREAATPGALTEAPMAVRMLLDFNKPAGAFL